MIPKCQRCGHERRDHYTGIDPAGRTHTELIPGGCKWGLCRCPLYLDPADINAPLDPQEWGTFDGDLVTDVKTETTIDIDLTTELAGARMRDALRTIAFIVDITLNP